MKATDEELYLADQAVKPAAMQMLIPKAEKTI